MKRLAWMSLMSLAGIALAADDSGELKHREQSFIIQLNGSVAEVTPLFGPVREAEWAPEWPPQFIHPAAPAQVEGAVFTTGKNDQQRIWVLTRFDVKNGRVEYVVVTPEVTANQIKIVVVPDGASRSKATITYRHTALSPDGNQQVEKLDAAWAKQQRSHWESAINEALNNHKKK